MHAQGYIDVPEAGRVTKYLQQAVRIGLLERVPVHGKKRSVYRHYSPVTDTALYLQEKYAAYDLPLDPATLARLAENRIPFHVERFIERLLSQTYQLRPVRILDPEVDIALARGRKLVIAAEVKWRRNPTPTLVRKAAAKLLSLQVEHRFLIVPDKTGLPEPSGVALLDAHDLVRLAEQAITRRRL